MENFKYKPMSQKEIDKIVSKMTPPKTAQERTFWVQQVMSTKAEAASNRAQGNYLVAAYAEELVSIAIHFLAKYKYK